MGALTKSGGGSVGFDFTKISATGQVLPNDAAAWQCVLDNNTGLMWQREFNDPHYNGNAFTGTDYTYFTYSWYNPDSQTNGGFAGSGDVADSTKSLVSRTNSNGMCGYNDWRLPTDQELVGIVDYGRENPSIDTDFFPETASKLYWTS